MSNMSTLKRKNVPHCCQVINFDSPRGGISLVTEKGSVTTSRLLIQKAIPSDTGLYTCDPSNANPASVRVHILNGKAATPVPGKAIRLWSHRERIRPNPTPSD
jgi:hypothetical protein